jgi:hypothetical protein
MVLKARYQIDNRGGESDCGPGGGCRSAVPNRKGERRLRAAVDALGVAVLYGSRMNKRGSVPAVAVKVGAFTRCHQGRAS